MADETIYERELRIEAAPSIVFELLTDPARYPLWMGFAAELDPRPGGVFRLDFGAATASGRFLEVVPNRRVVFSWGWEGGVIPLEPGASTVEFTLTPDGPHTTLHMRHTGLSEAMGEFHAWGWDRFLPRLAQRAAGREPDPDPMRDGPPVEQLRRLFERLGTP